ncbi:hypothetical protein D3C80_1847060 [compost metagenome]
MFNEHHLPLKLALGQFTAANMLRSNADVNALAFRPGWRGDRQYQRLAVVQFHHALAFTGTP